MRDIIEAKIAALEESAAQFKALAEMKPRRAEDPIAPPHNPETFRQRGLEDKHNAMAALLAARTLKAILAYSSTKSEQIALMRHYLLEFGQSASRKASRSRH